MIVRGYQLRVRRRSRGLGQQQLDAWGNPVSCPSGTHYAAGACIQLCNQAGVTAQYACAQSNQQAWDAAAAASGQITDPATGFSVLPGQVIPAAEGSLTSYSRGTPATITVPPSPPPPVSPATTVTTIPTCAFGSYWSTVLNSCVVPPLSPAPQQQQQVINPSPGTQSAATGTSALSPGSVLSQANGTTAATGDLLSSVAGYVNAYPSLISGVSNATLLAVVAVGAGVLLLVGATKGRR